MTLTISNSSQLGLEAAEAMLKADALPLRLAVNGADGCPLVASHWFTYEDGLLRCVVHKASLIARRLAVDPRCGFEMAVEAPPYRGVRGQASVRIYNDGAEALLRELFARYQIREDSRLAKWLMGRAADERVLEITPDWVSAWDFSDRMEDAV